MTDQKNNSNYKDGGGREVRSSYRHLQSGLIAGYMPDENSLFEFSYDNAQALADIYRNINAQIGGLEIEASKRLNQHYSIQANLAYVDKTNTTDNRAIAQTPPTNGKIQLDYKASSTWSAGSKIRFALAQNKVDLLSKQEVGQTPAWGVIDIYGHYRFTEMVNLRFGIDNLLNATYAEHISRSNLLDNQSTRVNEPGLTTWAKLTAEF